MRALISHFIQDKFSFQSQRGRFRAVGLFVDLSGFSTMAETLMNHGTAGAETLVTLMQAIFGSLVVHVYNQGGFVARTAGDAFTALFPVEETSPEDATLRALTAAWGMQEYMASVPIQRTAFGDFAVRIKIGLASGEVGWGIVVSLNGKRAAYYFQGSAVDGCAAAEHHAQPGDIILDATLLSLISNLDIELSGSFYRLVKKPDTLLEPLPVILPEPNPEVMQVFFPEILISQKQSGEFRHIISLFISLPTVRNETQLATFMNTVFDLQDRFGGLLSTLDFGDKGSNLLIFWGAPITLENDTERALNFILELQNLTSIPISAGMTYQLAYAGFLGSQYLDEYNCYGKGIALAARLMTAAPRGEVWVTEQIVNLAQANIEFEAVGLRIFKGFSEKQNIFLLQERKAYREVAFDGQIVGREDEIARLTEWIKPVWQGKSSSVMVIWGEAGIGKSRLVHEFFNSASFCEHHALVAVCQTSEILREPFNPLRYWLRHYLEQSEGQTERNNKRNFNRKLDELIEHISPRKPDLADDLDRTRSFLGALVDLFWPDSLYEQMDPQSRFQNTLQAVIYLIQAESLRQPMVLFLEDVHWLDEDTCNFLPLLNRSLTCDVCQDYPIGILATARREVGGDILGDGLTYSEISLSGLLLEQLEGFAEGILGGAPSINLVELLSVRAEGNPLFAEQILRYLKEQNLLSWDGEHWQLLADLDQLALPTDIGAVLVARLDRLAKDVKEVVQAAAVLGREFELLLLRQMLKDAVRIDQQVTLASKAAIWSALDEFHYLFQHTLLREAAYRMQVTSLRRSLHALAVDAMETLYARDLMFHLGELAFHCELAGFQEKARLYYRKAAEAAREQYLNNQAIQYYTRSLELSPVEDIETRYTILVERVKLFRLLANHQHCKQDLELLELLAAEMDDKKPTRNSALVERLWASYYLDQVDFQASIEHATRAIYLAKPCEAFHTAIEAYCDLAYALLRLGRHAEALDQTRQGLELARSTGNREGERTALIQLGLNHLERGDLDSARKNLEDSLEISRQFSDLRGQAMCLTNLGNLFTGTGSYLSAMEYYQEALRLVRVIGDYPKVGLVLVNLGFIAGTLGDFPSARQHTEQALRIARQVGGIDHEALLLVNLSAYAGRQCDYPAALANARQGLALAQQTNDPSLEAWAWTYLGHACLLGGDSIGARESYSEALQIRHRLNQPGLACEPLAGLARQALLDRNLIEASAHVKIILDFIDGGGTFDGTDEPLHIFLSCIQVLLACQNPRAREILQNAYNLLAEQASRIEDVSLRATFLENIPYHREIVRLRGLINSHKS